MKRRKAKSQGGADHGPARRRYKAGRRRPQRAEGVVYQLRTAILFKALATSVITAICGAIRDRVAMTPPSNAQP